MCNHYRIKNAERVIAFAKQKAEKVEPPGWRIFEDATPWGKSVVPVVYQAEQRILGTMRWGFWPWYSKPLTKPRFTSNARDDALGKSTWKKAVREARCLIPADGFYEWCGPKGSMWEVLFHLPDEKPFFFAGLWAADPVGNDRGFAFLTSKPNDVVAALPHDRMPVILDEAAAEIWLGNKPLEESVIASLCVPISNDLTLRRDMPRVARQKADTLELDVGPLSGD